MSTTIITNGASLSLSALSREFSTTRETLRKRLASQGINPTGTRSGYPVYRLRDALQAWIGCPESGFDPDALDPFKRRAHYQGEHEKLKLEIERGLLVPVIEVEQEMAALLKIVAETLDGLPDMIERDAGVSSAVLILVERLLDNCRNQLYERLAETKKESITNE